MMSALLVIAIITGYFKTALVIALVSLNCPILAMIVIVFSIVGGSIGNSKGV